MQYLLLDGNETLVSMSNTFGQSTVSAILAENSLTRTPNVAAEWEKKCQAILDSSPNEVSAHQKMNLLNRLTNDETVFEKACLMDEDEWKIFAATMSFPDALLIPEDISLPQSSKVIGTSELDSSGGDSVSSVTYRAVMNSLNDEGYIDPSIFNSVNTGPDASISGQSIESTTDSWPFKIPWGKIQMYSTVLKESIDFPVYPDQIEKSRQASYASMPDIIYQYEPWITFQNSGPREQSLDFHMHRDMWSGNHLDGRANKLIRFCEANTFADYNGSAVITPLVRFYIDGSLFISGVLKNVNTTWTGPIGQDNWYLEFTLSLVIQEISESALNCNSFYTRTLKEG